MLQILFSDKEGIVMMQITEQNVTYYFHLQITYSVKLTTHNITLCSHFVFIFAIPGNIIRGQWMVTIEIKNKDNTCGFLCMKFFK